jgi:hypothetical protein
MRWNVSICISMLLHANRSFLVDPLHIIDGYAKLTHCCSTNDSPSGELFSANRKSHEIYRSVDTATLVRFLVAPESSLAQHCPRRVSFQRTASLFSSQIWLHAWPIPTARLAAGNILPG